MIDVTKLPAVRAQLERDLAARTQPKEIPAPSGFARAPQVPSVDPGIVRAPAARGAIR
jgi:hypothetical protein